MFERSDPKSPEQPALAIAEQKFGAARSFPDIAFWCALATYAAILPLEGTTALRYLCLFVLTGLFLIAIWYRRIHFKFPLAMPWAIYAVVAAISLIYAVDVEYSLSEIRVEIFYPLVVFLVAENSLHSRGSFEKLIWILCGANIPLIAYSFFTAVMGGSTKDGLIGTWNTGVGNFSTYIVMLLPPLCFLAREQWLAGKYSRALGIVLLLVADIVDLYITQNRQTYVALLAELAVVATWITFRDFNWRQLAVIVAGATLVAVLLLKVQEARFSTPDQDSFQVVKADVRLDLWRFAFDRIAEKPWSGGGFGLRVFQKQYNYFSNNPMLWHAHNIVINKGIQMGIPGMLAFLLFYAAVPWRMVSGFRGDGRVRGIALAGLSVAAGVFVKNMTDDFFNRELAQLYWLLAGAVIASISQFERAGDS